jgi:hypothetical protein
LRSRFNHVDPASGNGGSLLDKGKREGMKMLKINLMMIPIVLAVMLYLYPPLSKVEQEKYMKNYVQNAGWKS